MFLRTTLICFGLLLLVAVAFAAPSGLIVIPTADLVPSGDANLQFEYTGPDLPQGENTAGADILFNTEFGWGDHVELGVDRSFHGKVGTIWNIKVRFLGDETAENAAAIGIQNAGEKYFAQPYVVAFHRFGRTRLHYGLMHIRDVQFMVGVNHHFCKWANLQADHTSGPGNVSSFGFQFTLTDDFTVTLGGIFGNSPSQPDNAFLQLSWTGPLPV